MLTIFFFCIAGVGTTEADTGLTWAGGVAGPLDMTGFPMGKGSSNGKDGMEIKKTPTMYHAAPITQRAKCKL